MPNKFSRFVANSPECTPPLPLTHTCDANAFLNILDKKQITTEICDVFGEPLIYFFYGRPAYKPKAMQQAPSVESSMPCSIVLKPDAISTPKRIAPFDTGAHKNGLYKNHVHPNMKIDEFLIAPYLEMPRRVVNTFFGSNKKYYRGKPRDRGELNIPAALEAARSYYDLISNKTIADDRRSTIEIQLDRSLQLNDKVLLVVLPADYFDDSDIYDTVVSIWKAEPKGYNTYNIDPVYYMGLVYQIVEEYLIEYRYI